ncbi:hypothetical protein J2W20_002947 [Sinomonas atrocyanea]|uniref:PIN-like domain-containing protein n=1 Tax=Sinomonas atrocyanea TaxID=37927 RepID=UPI0027881BAD|nr:hypothetical protein [Sinomonas atrocyanea]MDQ0261033.1 hypothetical protein [Sinomonas atrocyanea]
MKLYLDQNLFPALGEPLAKLHRRHQFRSPQQESLGGVEDIELFETLQTLDFDAIITQDANQLVRDEERTALRRCSLHWIGVPQLNEPGTHGLASQLAMVTLGLPYFFDDVDSHSEPHLYRLRPVTGRHSRQPTIEPL